jgi:hypothetical protein
MADHEGDRTHDGDRVTVTVERWYDGVLADSQDHEAPGASKLRESLCPTSEGWKHFTDEGRVAAAKARAVFLFTDPKGERVR